MRTFSVPSVLSVLSVLLWSCSGDEIGLDGTPGSYVVTADCTGAETFVEGMEVTSTGGYIVALASASPAPPDVGDNTWTLQIRTTDGPATGLEVRLRPWMPLHGHGLSPATYAGTEVSDGTYDIEMFDVIMPGLWEFKVEIGEGDEAVFPLCAAG